MKKSAFDPGTWDDDDRLYFEHVDRMLEKRRNTLIGNSQPLHAVYLINAVLRSATKTFRLFSGSLKQNHSGDQDMPIYSAPEVIASACGLLGKPESRLDILLENDIDVGERQSAHDHPLVKAIRDLPDSDRLGSFRLHKADDHVIKRLQQAEICDHLMVVDERAIRLETEHSGARAFANFGDSDMGRQFAEFYDKVIWKNSVQLIRI